MFVFGCDAKKGAAGVIASYRIESVRFGSVRFDSVRPGSMRFGSVRFVPLHLRIRRMAVLLKMRQSVLAAVGPHPQTQNALLLIITPSPLFSPSPSNNVFFFLSAGVAGVFFFGLLTAVYLRLAILAGDCR